MRIRDLFSKIRDLFSKKRDYETKKTAGAHEPPEPPSLAPMYIIIPVNKKNIPLFSDPSIKLSLDEADMVAAERLAEKSFLMSQRETKKDGNCLIWAIIDHICNKVRFLIGSNL